MSLNTKNDFLHIKEEDYNTVIAVYDMTDKMVQETMESMRQWYKMQPHLPEGYLSNDRLFRHLLAVGFSTEKAKEKIDNMLTARNIIPELLTQRDPAGDWYKKLLEYFYFGFIPNKLDDMTRIFVLKFTTKNPSDVKTWDAFKSMIVAVDYRLSHDISVGNNLIVDFKGITLSHIAKVNLTLLKKLIFILQNEALTPQDRVPATYVLDVPVTLVTAVMQETEVGKTYFSLQRYSCNYRTIRFNIFGNNGDNILQDCYGAKVEGLHYVNVPHAAEFIISLFKSVSSKKVAGRHHVHEDYESLQKVIPKTHLPSDFGGDNLSMKELAENLRIELCKQERRDWFIQQDAVKANESKRVGVTSDISNQLLGIQGSFRNLDVD